MNRRCGAAGLLCVVALAGCSDDDPPAPTVPPTLPTFIPSTTPPSSTGASTAPTTTPGSTDPTGPTTTGNPTSTPTTPAPTVASTPPLSTLVPQVPGTLDPNDPNNQRPVPTPEEQAVIDAYIRGSDALAAFYATFPWNPEDPLLLEAPFTNALRSRVQEDARQTETIREVLDVSGGLTYRPYLVGFEPGDREAFLFDCELDASVWRNADTGEVVPPPNPGYANTGPEVATPVGLGARMVLQDGAWLIDRFSVDGRACV